MGVAARVLVLAVVVLAAGGPCIAQVSADEIARRLAGSAQDIAGRLSGAAGPPAPIQTFEHSSQQAQAPSVPGLEATPRPQAAPAGAASPDQVEGLVVQARRAEGDDLPGPAWWKVTGGGATAWIMGVPDLMPLKTQFDTRALEKHMAAAQMLIIPGSPAARVINQPKVYPVIPKLPLEQRLAPALYARLTARIGMNNVRAKAQRDRIMSTVARKLKPDQIAPLMPTEYAPLYLVTDRMVSAVVLPGDMGNPARDAAKLMAARNGQMLVKDVGFSAASFSSFRSSIIVSDSLQQQCLAMMLNFLDEGESPATLSMAVQAWASGDVTHALKHYDPQTLCPFGPVGGNFWARLVNNYVVALKSALAKPGETVAIVEFDPLLVDGGVLDQLRAAGFTVTPPATL